MRILKTCFIAIILIIGSGDLVSCSCGRAPSIDEYDYVALVEVVGVLKSDLYKIGNPNEPPKPIFHEIKVKTIEQYKGRNQDFLIVLGGNNKYNVGWTSCDMNIEIGAQWIIYGEIFKQRISTNYCTSSIQHKNPKLEIDFKHNKSTNRLKELEKTFRSNVRDKPTGVLQRFYDNGKKQLVETYNHNSELVGNRQAFYSNGQLMLDEFYSAGLKNGTLTWYYKDGTLHRTSTFKMGKEICETYYNNYKGRLRRINYFDDDGTYIATEKKFR